MSDENVTWEKGICKPLDSQPEKPSHVNCHPLWYNNCAGDSDCCSGFCYLGADGEWQGGVCKPSPKSSEGNRIRK